jgi:hypothetical protein
MSRSTVDSGFACGDPERRWWEAKPNSSAEVVFIKIFVIMDEFTE